MSRLTRHEILKEDKFILTLEVAQDYFRAHQKRILMIAGATAGVVLLGLGIYYYFAYSAEKSKEELGAAFTIYQASVGTSPSPGETGPVFKTAQEKYEKALAGFKKVVQDHGSSTSGKIASYYVGLCLRDLNRDSEAIAQLEPLSKEKNDYAALSLVALAGLYEKQGNLAKSAELYQQVVALNAAATPKSAAMMHLAELLERQNKSSEALKIYQQLIKEFPESSLTAKAEDRIKLIAK